MARLGARKEALEAQLAQGEDVKVAVHPNMAGTASAWPTCAPRPPMRDCQAGAAEIIRTLLGRIELAPVEQDGRKTFPTTLHGHLAGILVLAANAKGPLGESDPVVACTKLVAGARTHLCRTFMAWHQPYRSNDSQVAAGCLANTGKSASLSAVARQSGRHHEAGERT
jgi:hypothetical protein